ncbi:uncharacterized protein [Coffea arabica]|uniref:Uncharacterized protein LOC113695774 n=1 Tax=Coffea arabica TaxID=13443 RepID=A0A6P6SY24_COFAR|nr:uncharacterized protein LOC113695774 [Coffea arabica]XP_027070721.1 uncharacterized protein LOC113695774 [Coffea arabica]XP_027070722.1 uncharacterized protein LOC113695774 [Coffea arabica]XP_027070723.1 uncharacterized protein LOC113695774 [Coffea arabica]XP_027070724.1 uncharacterized protein LOC113695774 [Coffea arabica]
MAYNTSSRTEPTNSHQWLMESAEAELFPNKKQAVEAPNSNSFSGFLNSNVSHWGHSSTFHSVANQFTQRLFDPETARTINFGQRNVPSVDLGNISMKRKVIEDCVESDFSFGLSISNSLEDPKTGLNYGGIRKVKVSQVKDTENLIPSFGHTYDRKDSGYVSVPHAFVNTDDNSVSMGLSFSRADKNVMSIGTSFMREDNDFVSVDQPGNHHGCDGTSIGPAYKENGSISLNTSLDKDGKNTGALSFQNFGINEGAVSHSLNMNGAVESIELPFSMDDSNIAHTGQLFDKEAQIAACIDHSYNNTEDHHMSGSKSYNTIDDNNLSLAHHCGKGESKIISFGGISDDDNLSASERLICSYDLLMGQSSVLKSETVKGKVSVESNADALAKATEIVTSKEIISRKKEEHKVIKKPPPNNFPSNVRSLLSTGILDGVPVKYIAWSREKELRGTIKGSGYLCGCETCNHTKAINAYEFERHAGSKTKHPNNHIYFENGKTVYGIVQELRNTPQNLLFDVIQTITGSPINQKSFRLWKESFVAATRELQRIYGKEEGKQLS